MLSGRLPFEGSQTKSVLYAILDGRYSFPSPEFDSISAEAKDLITKLICVDVSKRLSASEALRHPWIVNGGHEAPISNRIAPRTPKGAASSAMADDNDEMELEVEDD
jgi:serine/threonine protein kinase